MKPHTKTAVALISSLLCLFLLASCATPNATPEKAIESLENEGYTVKEKQVAGLIHFGEGIDAAFEASKKNAKKDITDKLYVIYYESNSAADTAWKSVEPLAASYRPDEIDEGDWLVRKSGRMIFFGTRDAAYAAN